MTKISALSDIGTSVASNDTFVLVDVSDPTTPNKKIQQQNLFLIPDGSQGTPALRFLNDLDVGLYRPTADALGLVTGGSEWLRIDSSGRVGIGDSAPDVTLSVKGTGGSIKLTDTTGTPNTWWILAKDASTPAFRIYDATNSAERLRIDSSGNVGIGTTGPSELIHGRSSGNAKLFLQNTSGNSTGVILQNDGQGSAGLLYDRSANTAKLYGPNLDITYENVAQAIVFNRSVNESARINNSGRLLVGTSSDSGGALLQVNGDRIRVATAKTPASASDTGTTGEICWDASYIYVCTATNTWKRAALSTW